ncbi:metallophosphoesterase [Aliiroseovarius sp. S1339]|uniref:metallophosphoesterase n=1 Tax=Aliiroseovarius sp. S1339 TaxID=2936990 RepID=UPI0020C12079|nr:metallophosphoesterase [Aliiroseovarius sp. S1339]MCK8463119.1 metallophosphoesterase [Aliiroseovarius sp. S1339]
MPDDPQPYASYSLPWRGLPSDLPEEMEVFAIGDVHGQADLLVQLLDEIKNTPRQARTRHLVFLGDLIDRGPESIRAVNIAMGAAQFANADELHVLPGNHDLSLIFALSSPRLLSRWVSDGGGSVLAEIGMSESKHSSGEITQELKRVLHPEYLHRMAEGPTHKYLGEILFVHAGVRPCGDIAEFLARDRFFFAIEDHWATMRYPFLSHREGWDLQDPNPERRDHKPTVIVHGHTPALRRDIVTPDDLKVCDGIEDYRTIALDIGAAYRPQLAFAHFRSHHGKAQVQISAVKKFLV